MFFETKTGVKPGSPNGRTTVNDSDNHRPIHESYIIHSDGGREKQEPNKDDNGD